MQNPLPILVTFDGQARSGKGTIVHAVKRSLLERGIKTMLIDAGQVFRVLVVSLTQHGVDIDSPEQIDAFLANEQMLAETAELVKKVYDMDHPERDALIYTLEVGANSAKVGARPKSLAFKDGLLKKWLLDARAEGYEIVLLDGRSLDEVGRQLEADGLCDFRYGLYFTCDAVIGAQRTLGFAGKGYDDLTDDEKSQVDSLVQQINTRNKADAERSVQPVVPPAGAPHYSLPHFDHSPTGGREMMIIDTSSEMTKEQMVDPIVAFFGKVFQAQQ